jgi:hypothetical protein
MVRGFCSGRWWWCEALLANCVLFSFFLPVKEKKKITLLPLQSVQQSNSIIVYIWRHLKQVTIFRANGFSFIFEWINTTILHQLQTMHTNELQHYIRATPMKNKHFISACITCVAMIACSFTAIAQARKPTKASPAPIAKPTAQPVYGKYACTASKYSGGSYEYIPSGSVTITKEGKYTYNGFTTPSTGTFVVDKAGNLSFAGGYLNAGKAEKIDRPNKFFLVFPTIQDNRWTCTLVE